ncbi:MAG: purine-nucleoside phosphorylase [Anaerolineaceae bacterium]|jgi:purine-nucleoside phosphorylase|nr:purine-nucleoside phosphorylase [Anaerolineaceae bacterium]
MSEYVTLPMIDEAVAVIRTKTSQKPKIGLILGSGLGDLAESVLPADYIHYSEIPHWPVSTIQGHKGRLVIGDLESKPVLIMQGRAHYYEGYPISFIGFPIRVMIRLGVEVLIVTNAAGGVNPDFGPGDVMLIKDHISLMAMGGNNPLIGPNIDEFGERFPDMSRTYDQELMKKARESAQEKGIKPKEGVYICLAGPSFETPADLRFIRTIGADAVGMSTVPEVIVAHHGGLRVLGLSGISNKANLDGSTVTSHEEVLEAGKVLVPKLDAIIRGVIRKI